MFNSTFNCKFYNYYKYISQVFIILWHTNTLWCRLYCLLLLFLKICFYWTYYFYAYEVLLYNCIHFIRFVQLVYPLFMYHAGCCYSTVLKNSHACVEGAMHHDCPICFEVGVQLLFSICYFLDGELKL
jgi:hypothetical protein